MDRIYSGEHKPVQGENNKYYIKHEFSKEEIKRMKLAKDQCFRKYRGSNIYEVFTEATKEEAEAMHEFEMEVARSEYNEDALTRCQICGKRNKSKMCTEACGDCEFNHLRKPSLNTVYEDENGDTYEFGDTIADSNVNVEEEVSHKMDMAKLLGYLDELSPLDREIALSGFHKDESQRKVFERLGIVPQTGRDRANKLINKLKERMLGE